MLCNLHYHHIQPDFGCLLKIEIISQAPGFTLWQAMYGYKDIGMEYA